MRELASLAVLVFGCAGSPAPNFFPADGSPGDGVAADVRSDVLAPDAPDGAGPPDAGADEAPPCGEGVYPCGPYGVVPSTRIANLRFAVGLRDGNRTGTLEDDPAAPLELAAFYREHLAPAEPPAYLLLVAAPAWCASCSAQARALAGLWRTYRPAGVEFLAVLWETYRRDDPADEPFLRRWAESNDIAFPLAADPFGERTRRYFSAGGPPFMLAVRLCDVQIVEAVAGWSEPAAVALLDRLVAAPAPCGAP